MIGTGSGRAELDDTVITKLKSLGIRFDVTDTVELSYLVQGHQHIQRVL